MLEVLELVQLLQLHLVHVVVVLLLLFLQLVEDQLGVLHLVMKLLLLELQLGQQMRQEVAETALHVGKAHARARCEIFAKLQKVRLELLKREFEYRLVLRLLLVIEFRLLVEKHVIFALRQTFQQ